MPARSLPLNVPFDGEPEVPELAAGVQRKAILPRGLNRQRQAVDDRLPDRQGRIDPQGRLGFCGRALEGEGAVEDAGEKISFERKRLGLSQEELACNVNVARQTVSSWERDVALPDSIYLIPLSKIFSCKIGRAHV